MELDLQREEALRARRQSQIRLLSERMDRQHEERINAHQSSAIEIENFRRVKKKLAVFYIIILLIIAVFITLTVLYWDADPPDEDV